MSYLGIYMTKITYKSLGQKYILRQSNGKTKGQKHGILYLERDGKFIGSIHIYDIERLMNNNMLPYFNPVK